MRLSIGVELVVDHGILRTQSPIYAVSECSPGSYEEMDKVNSSGIADQSCFDIRTHRHLGTVEIHAADAWTMTAVEAEAFLAASHVRWSPNPGQVAKRDSRP